MRFGCISSFGDYEIVKVAIYSDGHDHMKLLKLPVTLLAAAADPVTRIPESLSHCPRGSFTRKKNVTLPFRARLARGQAHAESQTFKFKR